MGVPVLEGFDGRGNGIPGRRTDASDRPCGVLPLLGVRAFQLLDPLAQRNPAELGFLLVLSVPRGRQHERENRTPADDSGHRGLQSKLAGVETTGSVAGPVGTSKL